MDIGAGKITEGNSPHDRKILHGVFTHPGLIRSLTERGSPSAIAILVFTTMLSFAKRTALDFS